MSEHWLEKKFELIDLLAIVFLLSVFSFLIGLRLGSYGCRADQKKVDDAECAEHPVVLAREVKFYLYENGRLVPDAECGFASPNPDDNRITCTVPAPAPPAKAGIYVGGKPAYIPAKPAKGQVTISMETYFKTVKQLQADARELDKAATAIKALREDAVKQSQFPPLCVIASPTFIWPILDESADKAKCEKEGGYWDHMDGTACYATIPEICVSHCDPKMPASQP